MKKTFLFLMSYFLLLACNKSNYYVYHQGETYCTIEQQKNGNIIYRAVSNEHYISNSTMPKEYVFIYSAKSDKENYLGIGYYYNLIFLKINSNNKREYCSSNTDLDLEDNFIHYTKASRDTIKLLNYNIKKLREELCFSESDLYWFPPFLARTKSIDYKKFKLPYNKNYLKTMEVKYSNNIEK